MFIATKLPKLFVFCSILSITEYIVTSPLETSATYSQEYVVDIQALQNVEIRARVKGFIEKLYVDEGQAVAKGQLLFSLNSKEYQDELLKAKAELKAAEADLAQAEVEIKNTKLLTEKNIVSNSELQMAQAKKQATLARIEQAKASISVAAVNLEYTQVKAPFSGIINRIPKKLGALVDEGELLTTISNNQEIYAYFNVSEKDYLQYMSNKDKNVSKFVKLQLADGSIFEHEGLIETIEGEIKPETGTIAFRAKFPNPSKLLKHGASGKVIIPKQLQNALLIPIKCTFEIQDNMYVYVVDKDKKVQQRQVDIKERLNDEFVVKSGLTAKDTILYEGVQLVKDDEVISPQFKSLPELSNPHN
jgi:RND family efflux transporter MFP subunit